MLTDKKTCFSKGTKKQIYFNKITASAVATLVLWGIYKY